jgi:hypothetical protein
MYYGMVAVRSVYCQDQIEVFLKDSGSILLVIQVGLLETEALLSGVNPHCIDSWILKIQDHRLIILKVLRTTIPKLFGHWLTTP